MTFAKQEQRAVVLVSGGIDSTTAMYSLLKQRYHVFPMHVVYGQKNAGRESYAIRQILKSITEKNSIERSLTESVLTLDLERIGEILVSGLTTNTIEIPDSNVSIVRQDNTEAPFRNGILISLAVSYANLVKASEIHIATMHNSDFAEPHADGTPEFAAAMNQAVLYGTRNAVKLVAPFARGTKTDILQLAMDLEIPLSLTYSCYRGFRKHCANCRACYERRKAFRTAGIKDPTEYHTINPNPDRDTGTKSN